MHNLGRPHGGATKSGRHTSNQQSNFMEVNMATEIKARYQVKDENNTAVLDAEGAPVWVEVTWEYDFGENLQDAVDKFGADVVFSQFVSAATVKIQSLMRDKKKAGQTDEQIQEFLNTYKIGMVVERTVVNPLEAFKAAFKMMTPEQQREQLIALGIAVD